MPRNVGSSEDFACRATSSLLNRRVTLHRYELTHRRYANPSVHSHTRARTGRVFLLFLVSGTGARATVLDFLAGVHGLNDCSVLENLHQGRTARMGFDYPDLQLVHPLQNRRPTRLVGHSVINSIRKLHRGDSSLHRSGQEFWERSRIRDWFGSAKRDFFPNSRVRQRTISRTDRWEFAAENRTAGCVSNLLN